MAERAAIGSWVTAPTLPPQIVAFEAGMASLGTGVLDFKPLPVRSDPTNPTPKPASGFTAPTALPRTSKMPALTAVANKTEKAKAMQIKTKIMEIRRNIRLASVRNPVNLNRAVDQRECRPHDFQKLTEFQRTAQISTACGQQSAELN